MVQRRQIQLIDDIDGTDAAGTVSFAFAGKAYEIDLSENNRAAFAAVLIPFIEKSRTALSAAIRPAKKGSSQMTPEEKKAHADLLEQIRDWSRLVGLTVAPTGRIKSRIQEMYARQDTLTEADMDWIVAEGGKDLRPPVIIHLPEEPPAPKRVRTPRQRTRAKA